MIRASSSACRKPRSACRRGGGTQPFSRIIGSLNALPLLLEGRPGKKAGKGFYEYPADGRKRLWHGLADVVRAKADQPEAAALIERLLVIQALEAARRLEEGIVVTPADADVGAYLGSGFALWTGGPIACIDTMGAAKFVEICRKLESSYGPRFRPTETLVTMAQTGGSCYGRRDKMEKAARAAFVSKQAPRLLRGAHVCLGGCQCRSGVGGL